MTFEQLGLMPQICTALSEQGYQTPTPIQQQAIPPALEGRDVLGCAQTGTGKTCAFAAPILQRLSQGGQTGSRPIRALVLTPTRELAIQIGENFTAYGAHLNLRSAVIFGGVGQQPQVDKLRRGLDILTATPGRLLDLHGQGHVDLSHIEMFVLDEADRMLDMGFIHDVRRVLRLLPEQKQTLFFSATMPKEVMELVNALLHDYVRVAVDPVSSPVEVIQQALYFVDKGNKTKLLAHLIQEKQMDSVLVFSRTKHGANRIAQDLEKRGISASAIHGNKSQSARQKALADFKAGRLTALIATDIAARGIDIDALNWVVNYDLPEVPETYVHRIGRTGRAGRDGVALSFCRADERDYLKGIEKLLGRKLPVVEEHPFPMVEPPTGEDPMVQARREGRENKRQSGSAQRRAAGEKRPAAPARSVQKPVQEQPFKRGVRQHRLEDTLPAQPARASGDFVRPDPLASDHVMDATARLLAPSRPSGGAKKPAGQTGQKGKRPPASQRGQQEGKGPRKGQKTAALSSAQQRSGAKQGGNRSRRDRGRPRPVELPKSRVKDSTEQPSLMKPYYLHDDD